MKQKLIQWKKSLPEEISISASNFSESILEKVSRTFALNIQILPVKLRKEVLASYLFCRVADTIEDDPDMTAEVKTQLLQDYLALFPQTAETEKKVLAFRSNLPAHWQHSDNWDQLLVYHCPYIFEYSSHFNQNTKSVISKWVREMCEGMIEFIAKNKQDHHSVFIHTLEDLDRYCYFVAGTVGNLLCDLFSTSSVWIGKLTTQALKKHAVSFGLGLQLTNILKDVWDDLDRKTIFLPQELLDKYQLTYSSLSQAENKEKFIGLTHTLIEKTKLHLQDAIQYTCLLPRLEPRLRLFCLWPLFMAMDTLILLGEKSQDHASQGTLKISRLQVQKILKETSLSCWSNRRIKKLFEARVKRMKLAIP